MQKHTHTTALGKVNIDLRTTKVHSITEIVHATYKFLLLLGTILIHKDHSCFEHWRRKLKNKSHVVNKVGNGYPTHPSSQTFQLLRQPSAESGREGRSNPAKKKTKQLLARKHKFQMT